MAIDGPGSGHGRRGVGVPPVGCGQAGEYRAVALVAAGPGGHVRGRREQVALVVVAPPVSQHRVLDSVDAAADPRDEVTGLRPAAEGHAAAEAPLSCRAAMPSRNSFGGIIRRVAHHRWRLCEARSGCQEWQYVEHSTGEMACWPWPLCVSYLESPTVSRVRTMLWT